MFRDPVDDLVEEMKKMEQKSRGRSISPNKRNCKVGGVTECYFPILSLPNKVISHIFSFLPIKDRMRARVNKKLNEIELESKYYVQRLIIGELCEEDVLHNVPETRQQLYSYDKRKNAQEIIFNEWKNYSARADCIRRITQNASIGELSIRLDPRDPFNREVYVLVKNFDVYHVSMDLYARCLSIYGFMNNSYFLELTKAFKRLTIPFQFHYFANSVLSELYKDMINGSSDFLSLELGVLFEEDFYALLSRVGITHKKGMFFSNRKIEAFDYGGYDDEENSHDLHFFDGNIEIWYNNLRGSSTMGLRSHESQESIERAKGGLVRIRVFAEQN